MAGTQNAAERAFLERRRRSLKTPRQGILN
jgi:hypothetical protein